MSNKAIQFFWRVILSSIIVFSVGLLFASGQDAAPPPIPTNPPAINITPATRHPAPVPVVAPAQPPPPPQEVAIDPRILRAIRNGIAALPPEDTGTWVGFFRALASKYPTWALLIGLRGLFGIIGFPIHVWLDRFLQKHLSAEKYAKVHTDGSTLFKQIDGLVNFVFSIKPSTVMAASSITKVSVVPTQIPPN